MFRLFVKGTEAETGVGDVSNCGRDVRKLGGPVLYCRRYTEYFCAARYRFYAATFLSFVYVLLVAIALWGLN